MGYNVTQLTPEAAEAHTRRTMGIPPDVGIGWTPYIFLVMRGAVPDRAFHTIEAFEAWMLSAGLHVREWSAWGDGVRWARLDGGRS